ncbi:MAG: hypothetical protein ACYDDF_12305 [Thermoplasmatota archaeon]
MTDYVLLLVRFLHITTGVFWLGSILYSHQLFAAVRRMPSQVQGPALLAIARRGTPAAIGSGVGTIVFGLWTQYITFNGIDFRSTDIGVALGAAFVCALLMLAVFIFVQRPAVRALGVAVSAGDKEFETPRRRMFVALQIVTLLGLIALLLMVYAAIS